jgi:uncharacterized protein (TIGR03382 family)
MGIPTLMKARIVLGTLVLAGAFGGAWLLRRRRIQVIDTTTPDPFGSAVVRETV